MGEVNFYLKKAEESTGHSLIYLQFKYKGNKLVFSFGQSVAPKNWNASKQRVKSNKQTTADGDHSLNDLLNNLKEVCEKAYKLELKNGIPAPDTLRTYLIKFLNQNTGEKKEEPTLFELIDRFIAGEIKRKGKEKSKGSLNNYRSVKIHLEGFEKKHRYKIDFNTITLDFFYKYTTYLEKDLKLAVNTVAKDISILKVFMGKAVDLGYTNNNEFRKSDFSYSEKETDAVYLTEDEIVSLYNYDFSFNKKLEQTRDLFVFGCFVGLRFSDYSQIKPENIVRIDGVHFIKMVTQKTKELVIIPCNPIVLKIFSKYESNVNRLPKACSSQKFNEYIKDVCRKAGLTEKGRLLSVPNKELCDCISSHTARRSMATNYYLQGFPVIDLMRCTGHKSEKAFLKYIRVSKLDSAKRLSDHIKKNWSTLMLKVAS